MSSWCIIKLVNAIYKIGMVVYSRTIGDVNHDVFKTIKCIVLAGFILFVVFGVVCHVEHVFQKCTKF